MFDNLVVFPDFMGKGLHVFCVVDEIYVGVVWFVGNGGIYSNVCTGE